MRTHRSALAFVAVAAVIAFCLPAAAAAQSGPFLYHAITPCRVVDSRTTNATEGTNGQPLPRGPHSFRIQGQCGVPVGATAITGNFTIVTPTVEGYLKLWPAGGTEPLVSTLNFLAGDTIANGAIVPLAAVVGAANDLSVRISEATTGAGTADFIIDVTGYFQ
jgi:hypothetical protein